MADMNNPTFRIDEIIMSDNVVGRIAYVKNYRGEWMYHIDTKEPNEHPEIVEEKEVLAVWRDNRWQTK